MVECSCGHENDWFCTERLHGNLALGYIFMVWNGGSCGFFLKYILFINILK